MQQFCLMCTLCLLLVSVKGMPKFNVLSTMDVLIPMSLRIMLSPLWRTHAHSTQLFPGATPFITPASGAIPLGRTNVEYTCIYKGQFQQWLVTVPSIGTTALALVPNGTPHIAALLQNNGIAAELGKPYVLLVNATSLSNGSSFVCTTIENGIAINSLPVAITAFGLYKR